MYICTHVRGNIREINTAGVEGYVLANKATIEYLKKKKEKKKKQIKTKNLKNNNPVIIT